MSQFEDWLACPECDGDSEVGVLAHRTEIILECYGCSYVSEFAIGQDVPVNSLSESAITDAASQATATGSSEEQDEGPGDSR
ncbi:hypothetical protein [Halostagnicola sp. A-GB9-2]|uniref:hypothetical protein n=1 Tax=Halostagnicola sp. A-GB9-2 TaxID=3048066 RepID=UPI0024BF77E2|nr:hypothetical protein [Halostagnicola sp. A-GB9-2]MDJ1431183.1 hypothetical protein [Halostagnicola sp. A-GB9-2]